MMRRRSFLSALAAAMTMDPERLLWVPGQKLISIPNVSVAEDKLAIFDAFMKSPWRTFRIFLHESKEFPSLLGRQNP